MRKRVHLKNLQFRLRSTSTLTPMIVTLLLDRNELPEAAFLIPSTSFNLPRIHSCDSLNLLNLHRDLKCRKAYSNLMDIWPTLRNKPSGLKSDWYRTVSGSSGSSRSSRSSTPHQQVLAAHSHSSSLSMSASPLLPELHSPNFDHTSSLLAMSPLPVISKSSMPLFHGDLVPLIDKKAAEFQEDALPNVVCICICSLQSVTHPSSHSLYPMLTRTTRVKCQG